MIRDLEARRIHSIAATDAATEKSMEITVYTKKNCPACEATKKAMDRAGLDYEVIDVSDNLVQQRGLRECGFRAMPVVEVTDGEDYQSWEGFRPDLIKKL